MKYLPLVLLAFAAIGCGHNEFDVSPAQVRRHQGVSRPAPSHSSPGRAEAGTKIKKGDRLPDGTIADHSGEISSDRR